MSDASRREDGTSEVPEDGESGRHYRVSYVDADGQPDHVDVVVGHDEGDAEAEEAARTALTEESPSVDTDEWDIGTVRFLGSVDGPGGIEP